MISPSNNRKVIINIRNIINNDQRVNKIQKYIGEEIIDEIGTGCSKSSWSTVYIL